MNENLKPQWEFADLSKTWISEDGKRCKFAYGGVLNNLPHDVVMELAKRKIAEFESACADGELTL